MTERLEPIKLAQLSRHELIKIIRSIESQLAEKDASIKMLINQVTDEVSISAKAIVERDRLRKALEEHVIALELSADKAKYYMELTLSATGDNERLRKSLDLAHSHLTYGGVSEALECISDASGEEVES